MTLLQPSYSRDSTKRKNGERS